MKDVQNIQIKNGFTIVELLLYMALLMIFLVVLTDIFTSIAGVRLDSEQAGAVAQDGTYILNRLMYDIHRADDITTPASPGITTSSLIITVGSDTLTYILNGTDLILTDSAGSENLTSYATEVTALTFTRLGNGEDTDTIQITLTLQSAGSDTAGHDTKTLQTTVGLR